MVNQTVGLNPPNSRITPLIILIMQLPTPLIVTLLHAVLSHSTQAGLDQVNHVNSNGTIIAPVTSKTFRLIPVVIINFSWHLCPSYLDYLF